MAAPANAWIERSEERMIVRCNYSLETWYLTCKGNDWIGTFTNCTDGNQLSVFTPSTSYVGGSVAEWLASWTQAQYGPGSNRSRDAVG